MFLTEIESYDPDDIDVLPDWDSMNFKGIIPTCSVTKAQSKQLEQISERIRHGFANDYKDLGKCNILPYRIKLISDEIVYIPPYRRSIKDMAVIEAEVEKLLKTDSSKYPVRLTYHMC